MARDFRPIFQAIPPLLREALPADLSDFKWSATSWQAKTWFGNKDIHYEIWVRYRAKVVELGLHFEADELTNARLYGAFRARSKEVKRALGSGARIEQWDKGWTRVWEPLPLESIDGAYTEKIQSRFVAYVSGLEPIVRDELPSEVAWKLSKPRRAARGSYSRASR